MAKKARETPAMARLQSLVALETSARMDEARAALKRAGIFVSASMFVEIAIRELLARRDLPDVMLKHKATARRDRD